MPLPARRAALRLRRLTRCRSRCFCRFRCLAGDNGRARGNCCGHSSGHSAASGHASPSQTAAIRRKRPRVTQLSSRARGPFIPLPAILRATCVGGNWSSCLAGRLTSAWLPTPTTHKVHSANTNHKRSARGVEHLGVMPAPASPLGIFKPAFDPTAHAVPDGAGLCWCQIGHDQPHFLVALIPACQQCALQAAGLLGETVHPATPGTAHARRCRS